MNSTHPCVNRREFLAKTVFAGLALSGLTTSSFSAGNKTERPNLVFILTDDQRWDSLGCMGNPIIQTPHLDQMAKEGVLFKNHFSTTSICMSSRASIFTGLYTRSHGIDDFAKPLPPEVFAYTYPVLLRKTGYRTGFVGKWGLGGDLPKDAFDYYTGFSGQGEYFQTLDGKEIHLTTVIGNQALDFLKGCKADQPFCLSISTKAPHVQDGHPDPYRFDPKYTDLYKDATIPAPETADPKYFDALPGFIRESEGRTRWQQRFATPELYQHSVQNYYRLITGVDAMVGRVREQLKQQGLDQNTIVVFTSDQGCFLGEHGLAGKWLMYEESIRSPLIICDPRLPENLRGERTAMTLNIDFASTLLEMAGLETLPFLQGKSLIPLMNDPAKKSRGEWFYEHPYGHGGKIPKSEGIRTEQWKYIRYYETNPVYEELYDLQADPLEKQNLAPSPDHQERLDALRGRLQAWRGTLDQWKPGVNSVWNDPA